MTTTTIAAIYVHVYIKGNPAPIDFILAGRLCGAHTLSRSHICSIYIQTHRDASAELHARTQRCTMKTHTNTQTQRAVYKIRKILQRKKSSSSSGDDADGDNAGYVARPRA